MKETIRVIINPDGITAREINPFSGIDSYSYPLYLEAESRLRTFQIDVSHINKALDAVAAKLGGKVKHINYGLEPGSIVEGELLDNGRIKIL